MTQTGNYVPGVCNINRAEVAYRRKAGIIGLSVAIVIGLLLFALGAHRAVRLVLFLPLLVAAAGFLQAKHRFCVKYGAAGEQNADDGSERASRVTDATAIKADKRRARMINLQATAIALLLTVLIVLI